MKRAGIIFFICVIIITGIIRITFFMGPVNQNDSKTYMLRIKKGSNSFAISKKLYNNNLILSKSLFNTVVSLTNLDEKLQAGYYELSPSFSMWKIIRVMVEGRVATFKVTIPEGYDIYKIINKLADKTDYNKQDFKKVITGNFIDREYLPEERTEYKYRLEGFLYPDTYIIPREFSPQKIIITMLEQFEEKWLLKLKIKAESSGYSISELMSVASLIESEAKIDEEKEIISAVIFNRIDKKMYLQIDAGIQYSIDGHKDKLFYRDLKIDSPYNTYRNRGLPPGPVCSPGDKAINAALHPADVDYLFYFALENGEHVFTKSYDKHLQLQKKLKYDK